MLPIGHNTLLASFSPTLQNRAVAAGGECARCGQSGCDCEAGARGSRAAAAPADPRRADRVELSPQALRLSAEQLAETREMKARDREVRSHEQAHLAAAGSLARGGASYGYETGPDGRQYAVSGEVSIDTAPVPGDPAATLRKAAQIRKAALAPARPSAQDRAVAAEAAAMAAAARQALAAERREENATPVDARESAYAAAGEPPSEASLLPALYA